MQPTTPATTSAGALGALQSAQASALTPQQAQDQADQTAGVGSAGQQVQGLRGAIQQTTSLLNQVAPSVYGRTGNSLTTNAQASAQIGNEQAPIQANLDKDTQDYTNANADYQTAETKADQQAQNTLSAQNSRLSYLQGIYGDLYGQEQDAAKSAEQQREFDATLADTKAARAASASSGASPTLGGTASSGTSAAASPQGSFTRDAAGGYNFMDGSGKAITAGQYSAMQGLQGQALINNVVQLLRNSNGGDKGIANAIGSGHYTPAQLQQLYPNVFGGSYTNG